MSSREVLDDLVSGPRPAGGRGRDLVSTLYGPDGRFLYKGRKLGLCAGCKRGDYTYDVGALGPSFRFCKACIQKEGASGLRHESNVALKNAKSVVDQHRKELKEMGERYAAKFGKSIDFTPLANYAKLKGKT